MNNKEKFSLDLSSLQRPKRKPRRPNNEVIMIILVVFSHLLTNIYYNPILFSYQV
jgi:hypothetical protein